MSSQVTGTQTMTFQSPPRPASPTQSIELSQIGASSTSLDNDLAPPHAVEQEDIPPNGGYGWVCTACTFVINAHTWGPNSAWGIFLAYFLKNDTLPGGTRLQYALITGLSVSQCLFSSPAIALMNRHLGTRVTLFVGSIVTALSLLLASLATRTWHLFLTQGFLFGWGMGCLYLTSTAVLPQWFSTRRSLAMGISASGVGIGGIVYNLAAGRAIETLGWRWTYRILGFCTLVANTPCAILLKDRNTHIKPKQTALAFREFKNMEVLLIVFWGICADIGYIVLFYSLPDYATHIGLSTQQGSVVGALFSLGVAIGRPLVGYCSDRLGRINVAMTVTAASGISCLAIWVSAKSYGLLLFFAIIAGPICGSFWGTVAPVVAEVVGMQRMQVTFGVICFALVVPATFAEAIALKMAETSGYMSTQIFVGGMFLLASMFLWLLRAWQIREVQLKASMQDASYSTRVSERSGKSPIPLHTLLVRGRV